MSELILTSHCSATRGLLATDHVILNHGQVTWTTPELAPPLLTTIPHQREDVSALDRFNVHRRPTRRAFSGTGIELMTCLPWLDTLTTGLPQPRRRDESELQIHPGEDSTRITLPGEFQLITEKNSSPFLWCPLLMFSDSQYPVLPVGCSQRDTQDWMLGVKDSLCKKAVERLPRNSSSRHCSKVSSKLRSRCPPIMSSA
ncbi:uncharacterized protein TNCV_3831861 [Trichonephila clavipes]|nr:uncharacterized protein TNCV_3831861 [Trichonephila clavipes]